MRWICVALMVLALPATASAAPALSGKFPVSGSVQRLVRGPDNNEWFTLAGSGTNKEFGRITQSGTVTEFDTPMDLQPIGITRGPDGNLWMTAPNNVIKVDVANPTGGTAFPITGLADPQTITGGPDGNLWTASGDKIFKIGINGTEITHYTVTGMGARGITQGLDGNLWVVDFLGQRIIKAPTDGAPPDPTTKFPAGGSPQEIIGGPQGQIGFAQPTNPPQFVGRMSFAGSLQKTTVPTGTDPFGIAFGNDRAYWAAEFGANTLGRYPTTGGHTQIKLGAGTGPRYLARGANNTLWIGLQTSQQIARITGVAAPTANPLPAPIPGDKTGPAISGYRFSSRVIRPFRGRGASIARRRARGARISYTLSEAASAKFTVQRLVKGRKVRGRCVRRTRRNAGRRACTRRVRRGRFAHVGVAGLNRFRFTGRVRRRPLRPGRYRMVLVATDGSGNKSKPRAVRFRVVKP